MNYRNQNVVIVDSEVREIKMNIDEIKKNKPQGATHYADYDGKILYFMNTKYGFRMLKGNLIQFDDSHIDHIVKPL